MNNEINTIAEAKEALEKIKPLDFDNPNHDHAYHIKEDNIYKIMSFILKELEKKKD